MAKHLFLIISTIVLIFTGCAKSNNTNNPFSTNTIPNQQVNKTTLHDAVRINDLEKVEELIKKGDDVNKKDRFGYTPLHLASRFNHFKIAKYLVEHKANVNTKDKYGDTPLIDSSRNGYTSISKLLICNGAKRDVLDKYGMSALHYAAKSNDMLVAKLLRAKDIAPLCNEKVQITQEEKEQFYNLITMDEYKVLNDNTPKICGDILDSDVRQIQITFDGGQTVTNANLTGDRWCAEVTNKVNNGNYTVMAMAINSDRQRGLVKENLTIKVENKLSSTLKNEFKNDLDKWDAQFDEKTLTFRFRNPAAIFERGSSNIKDRFKAILDNFLPRYINILKGYKNDIVSVYIEGHTSSRYRSAPTKEEKFEKNRVLSQKRADSILSYLKQSNDPLVSDNIGFIDNKFLAKGKSSSELIYNEDGTENYELSRRVEFKIESK